MDIGEKIKQRRVDLGLTLEEVGKIVGVGKSTVRKWETGDIKNMRRDKIGKLAFALKVSPSFIMGEDLDAKDRSEKDAAITALLSNIAKLTPENREKLADYLTLLLQTQK